jgi:hypothetical protein
MPIPDFIDEYENHAQNSGGFTKSEESCINKALETTKESQLWIGEGRTKPPW